MSHQTACAPAARLTAREAKREGRESQRMRQCPPIQMWPLIVGAQ